MRSTKPIYHIFKKNMNSTFLHHPTKFHQNRSITFWDKVYKDSQKDTHIDRHTDRYIHIDKNNSCQKTQFLGQVISW